MTRINYDRWDARGRVQTEDGLDVKLYLQKGKCIGYLFQLNTYAILKSRASPLIVKAQFFGLMFHVENLLAKDLDSTHERSVQKAYGLLV